MPVFIKDQRRVLFIHVPKTGGTSVEFFFEKNGWHTSFIDRGGDGSLVSVMKCSPQHLHGAQLQTIFRLRGFDYIFMTVRHPVDRLVSEYRMRAVMQEKIQDIDTWIADVFAKYPGNNFMIDNHIRPQSEFWLPGCEVYRQEDGFGEQWVSLLSQRARIAFDHRAVEVAMRFPNVAQQQPSAESLRRIHQFYAKDFEQFGYAVPADA